MEQIKVEFANRLQRKMIGKGWTRKQLADEARRHMPDGGRFEVDNLSFYLRAKYLPKPDQMRALCKALGVHHTDLVPPFYEFEDDKNA